MFNQLSMLYSTSDKIHVPVSLRQIVSCIFKTDSVQNEICLTRVFSPLLNECTNEVSSKSVFFYLEDGLLFSEIVFFLPSIVPSQPWPDVLISSHDQFQLLNPDLVVRCCLLLRKTKMDHTGNRKKLPQLINECF